MKSKLIFIVNGNDVEIDYIKDFIGIDDSLTKEKRDAIISYLSKEGFLDPNIIMGMKGLIKEKGS